MRGLKYLIIYMLVAAAGIYMVSLVAPDPYVVRMDYTNLSVVEIIDPDGKPANMNIEDLKSKGLRYTTVWVAPSTMK